jgi:phospholipid/cholesterol/gamma-HCH transport system permease protein
VSTSFVYRVGASALSLSAVVGQMAILFAKTLRRIHLFDRDELFRSLHKMAVRSLPIVIVTALFAGVIMVTQTAPLVKRVGAEGLLGWGAGFGTLREIAPLLTALMISGRVGANNTAELGTMVATEQIDALRVLAIDPIAFLIVPRFLGMVVTMVTMTLFADALALIGAAYTGQGLLGVSPVTFYNGLTNGLLQFDAVGNGLLKAFVFGIIIALSSCYYGLATTGGAPGVGRAVNGSVVTSAAGIFVVDYFVSFVVG